jgi:hypothetical protein
MAAHHTGTTVVFLDSHPVSRSARRRSRELRDAMRRHPSSQCVRTRDHDGSDMAGDTAGDMAVVLTIPTR